MRRGTLRVAMTVLAVCALGACTGDEPGDPRTFPPYTAPASPTPTPTPTAPPASDAATPPERPDLSTVDAETAEAVAVYFLQLYPYVYATGDLTEWKALSHPECVFCASVVTEVEEMTSAGEHWVGGSAQLTVRDTNTVSSDFFDVAVDIVESPARRVSADDHVLEESVGGSGVMYVVVTAEEGAWLVRGVEVE